MKNFIHYVKREVVMLNHQDKSDPWFADDKNRPEDQGFDAPSYHVTRARTGTAVRAEEGDTIWLFSQLSSPWGSMPPALDAKIVISDIKDNRTALSGDEPAFRFAAGRGSKWFPIFDAESLLAVLKTVDGLGKIGNLRSHSEQHVGAAMRRMRELADPAPLVQLEQSIEKYGFEFISYRLADGTRRAFERCSQIVRDGKAAWWDRWSLPRRIAEYREILSEYEPDDPLFYQIRNKLDDHIVKQIQKKECNCVWGIESALYADAGSYSLKEKNLALELKKYRRSP
jgi:hypothetical protein